MSDDHKQNSGGEGHGDGGHGGGGHGGGGHGGGGHGGGSHEEHEGAPEWLISFADNVALLMGFFVILLAMNMGPKAEPVQGGEPDENAMGAAASTEARMDQFIFEMRKAFNSDLDPSKPNEAAILKRMRDRAEKGESRDPGPDGDKHNVQAPRTSDFVNIAGYVTYHDRESDVPPEYLNTLKDVAARVRGNTFMIEVRGHVSALESRQDKPLAMELAYKRALSAAEILQQNGVRWEQMRVVACADNERATPRAQNAAGHRNNQRAEIVVTQERMPPDPLATVPVGP